MLGLIVTIKKAIEIRDGVVLNQDILAFQNRKQEYPYNIKSSK